MRCTASAVFDVHGEAIACISVSGPTSRMSLENIENPANTVMQAAAEPTAYLDGTPDRQEVCQEDCLED